MDIDQFVDKHLELLELERNEEVEQSAKLQEKFSLKELQSKGLCITKLVIDTTHTGLYGRTVCKFRSCHHGAPLPSHRFSSGDIAGLVISRDAGREVVCSGVVCSVSQASITLAFDESHGCPESGDGQIFNLLKLANDVTYRRLKRTLEKLRRDRDVRFSSLVGILFGDSSPGRDEASPKEGALEFFDTSLDESQREAVEFSLLQRELAVIHGPPGTGKTTTLVEVVRQCVKRGAKVLVCAPSNVAVDNLVERLATCGLRLVRLGHPARLLPGIAKHSLDAVLANFDDFATVEDIRKEIDAIVTATAKCGKKDSRHQMFGKLSELRKELVQRERKAIGRALSNSDVVLSTLTTASDDGPLRNLPQNHFDVAVVDECSQALEAACWMALLRAPKCILAGDHLQLPPTIVSETAAKAGLAVTLMERALACHGEDIKRMLKTQYRMNELIMKWPSECLYEGKLVAHESVASHLLKDLPGVEDNDDTNLPLLLIDTAGCGMTELDTPDDESKGNEGEADLVAIHVERLVSGGVRASDIAVISPYNLQVELIQLRLCARHPTLEVRSVDGFQGREKEAVVLSLVRSNDAGNVGFLTEDRRINVAITRARRHVAVICDSVTVSRHNFLKSLVDYITAQGEIRSAREYSSDLELCPAVRPKDLRLNEARKKPAAKPKGKPPLDTMLKNGAECKGHHANSTTLQSQKADRDVHIADEVRKEVEAFVASSDMERAFPSTLTSYQRRLIHEVSEGLGLLHVSEGDGLERHIVLRKRTTSSSAINLSRGNVTESTTIDVPVLKNSKMRGRTSNSESGKCKSHTESSSSDSEPTEVTEKLPPQTTKASSSSKKQRKKKPTKVDVEEDFDALIASVVAADRTCGHTNCKQKLHIALAGTGGPCPFCKRGFCFEHALPEAHGCGDEARAHARAAWHHSRGGTVTPGVMKPDKRAQVQKVLGKQLAKMADSRKRQTKK